MSAICLPVLAENIPQALRSVPHWVDWKHVQRGGELTKLPFQPDGQTAKSNVASTW